jgi:hypothetical protein
MKATHTPAPADVVVTPAVVLRGAARYLQLHGWTQGTYYADQPDNPTPPACLMGALAMAAFGQRLPTDAWQWPEWADYKRAEDILLDHLGRLHPPTSDDDYPEPGLGDWNDQPDRTAKQVIAALAACADDWDDTHPAQAVTR